MAMVDLAQCVERLTPQVAYLAARGLAIRFVDSAGSTRAFLERAAEAAPGCDVVVVHAPANELCRMFAHGRGGESALPGADVPCPIVIADDRPPSVTHAYASMKLLAQRAGLVVSELMLGAAPHSPRAERIAAKLAGCADNFFAGVLRDWARIDPAGDPCEVPGGDLRRLVAARFENHAAIGAGSRPAASHSVAWAVQ
jgi:flagellar biosynthesis protein FlhG